MGDFVFLLQFMVLAEPRDLSISLGFLASHFEGVF
jgi:hypothetical protein